MAANNYFGFAHGGTQYAATASAAYQPTQSAYGVAAAAANASSTFTTSRAATAYDTAAAAGYQVTSTPVTYAGSTPASYDYGYGRPGQATLGVSYDSSKTYYQQAAQAAAIPHVVAANSAATASSSQDYQAVAVAKGVYNSNYSAASTSRALAVQPIIAQKTTAPSVPYSQYTTQQIPANYVFSNNQVQSQNQPKAGVIGPPKKKQGFQQSSQNVAASSSAAGASFNSVPVTPATYPSTSYPTSSVYNMTNNANKLKQQANYGGINAPGAVAAGASYVSPYDAALINAATALYMNQNQRSKPTSGYSKKPGIGSAGKAGLKLNRMQPRPQQLHYCDACKISCAGSSAYHDHLQGQKHKKKVSKSKEQAPKGNSQIFFCKLCDVECTAADAYAAHLRGAKHSKVMKLHTRLGKDIPPLDPKAVTALAKLSTGVSTSADKSVAGTSTTAAAAVEKKMLFQKIKFVGPKEPESRIGQKNDDVGEKKDKVDEVKEEAPVVDERPAVGQEFIEDEKDSAGKLISYNCKLCDCKFSDPNAKEMHMKGRKHRLQYKRKVDPHLQVEVKASGLRFRKSYQDKLKKANEKRRLRIKQEKGQQDLREKRAIWEKDVKRYDEEMKDYREKCRIQGMNPNFKGPRPLPPIGRLQPPQPPPFMLGLGLMAHPFMGKPHTLDDRYVLTRHRDIYPSYEHLKHIQRMVSGVESALKLVSDEVAEEEEKQAEPMEVKSGDNKEEVLGSDDKKKTAKSRLLTGVFRVGILAKGLILHDDKTVDLVMLCSVKPTISILNRVYNSLPKHLKETLKDVECNVVSKVQEAALSVTLSSVNEDQPKLEVVVTFTSPIIREELMAVSAVKTEKAPLRLLAAASDDGSNDTTEITPDPADVLNKMKCLDALAVLRHAKWFQARAAPLQSCVLVIRVLRDLCKRDAIWTPLGAWAMELLTEKVLSSCHYQLSPGDAFRRVLQSLACGILLPTGPGIQDPCEKDPVDAASSLTPQQREDITASAQLKLRQMAFQEMYKVLDMGPIAFNDGSMNKNGEKDGESRKRRRADSAGGKSEGDGEEKKDKVEEKMDTDDTIEVKSDIPNKVETITSNE